MPFNLAQRCLEPEEMDDPALPADKLQGALSGLTRLNRVSNSARIVWPPIQRLAKILAPRRVRVLDIATGAGDIPIALHHRARCAKLDLEILGVDINPQSVEFARRRAGKANAAVQFECLDALRGELPAGFDVVMCSLFLHHLARHDAVALLRKMADATRVLGLVSDLRRSAYGLALAYTASRLLSRSRIVHGDAVKSVCAAFTIRELEQLAVEAGIPPGRIGCKWPARMLLGWYTPAWSQRLDK